jgi:NitT/TauT family transport system ATP-binding protein
MTPPLLWFRDVWVEYGEAIILERVNLTVRAGEFVSIVGPSGAGKSTFLRLVLGQEAPSRGAIDLDGERLVAEPGRDRGVVFQRYSVFPHLSAVENVLFGLDCRASPVTGRLWGKARRAARAEAETMLAAVGLGAARDVYPAQLSGGMQQRLAIAQALVMRPRILLLDEPFGALDPGVRLEHALTILMVTHDIKEAFKLGTRVVAFDKRRHDPHVPHRHGAAAVYDFPLEGKR